MSFVNDYLYTKSSFIESMKAKGVPVDKATKIYESGSINDVRINYNTKTKEVKVFRQNKEI